LTGSVLAGTSFGGSRLTVTKTNNASHKGVFSQTETVPASATFPWTVTYRLTIFGGTTPGLHGPFHKIDSITDSNTTNIGTCQALVGTNININQTEVCSYTVTLTAPQTSPLVNTAKLVYEGRGHDVATSISTVNFEPRCADDKHLTKRGLCCPPGKEKGEYCEPLPKPEAARKPATNATLAPRMS